MDEVDRDVVVIYSLVKIILYVLESYKSLRVFEGFENFTSLKVYIYRFC